MCTKGFLAVFGKPRAFLVFNRWNICKQKKSVPVIMISLHYPWHMKDRRHWFPVKMIPRRKIVFPHLIVVESNK